ncbi:MAG: class I SAM-dependent methyltransferase [Candidatus Latescibacterota bacterium]|nr:MAG: class I SAM-dependent methyltransferase [Candidatus Latescibacterota bacterium]
MICEGCGGEVMDALRNPDKVWCDSCFQRRISYAIPYPWHPDYYDVKTRWHPEHPAHPDAAWKLLRSVSPRACVVEIGALFGDWTVQAIEKGKVGTVFSIDPWAEEHQGGPIAFMQWQKKVEKYLYDQAIPIRARSQDFAPYFPLMIDILYIDGSHRYKDALEDMKLWTPKVRPGGLILVHDMNNKGVLRAAHEFFGVDRCKKNLVMFGPKVVPTFRIFKEGRWREDG